MNQRPFNWSWEQKTEEDRRHTLMMRIQVEPWDDVCYDYLLAAAGETAMTAEEARSLKWLAGCELSTVMNVAAVLRKAREQASLACVKAEPEPVHSRATAARKRSSFER